MSLSADDVSVDGVRANDVSVDGVRADSVRANDVRADGVYAVKKRHNPINKRCYSIFVIRLGNYNLHRRIITSGGK